ncbi:MAG: aminomethyl-transferring glycine dehydrogenase subunit GcvPA [Gammaproteobacteria bacterium]|nr:aminomethyl-transferring glycine dehydrogenase subunit GcvPA [Gammaproteobacteria bacterium]
MPFIPHSEAEVAAMLQAIGVQSLDDLFDEIPAHLQQSEINSGGALAEGMSEMEVAALMQQRAAADGQPCCFIGAGAYDHHIPAAVWELAGRGELYSAYTPYQAEASQGVLQITYEFQSMITRLLAMEVSNASLYDGATALAEALLMAVRANRHSKSKRILIPRSLNPRWRQVVHTIVHHQGIELVEVGFNLASGQTDITALEAYRGEDFAALVIVQPNYFGTLEPVDELVNWAHQQQQLAVAVVNPTTLALLTSPGKWGAQGADIAVGEGQPLGIPLSSGGPYLGFMGCRQTLVRQMPGRIVGRTVDSEGKPGFTLTLQAREQHIRRSKATSNICTNQGLMAMAVTFYLALMGTEGLTRTAQRCYRNTHHLVNRLTAIEGVTRRFNGPYFHEAALTLPLASDGVLTALAAQDLLGGYDLTADYPELGDALLVCATEKRSDSDIERYFTHLERILGRRQRQPPCQKKIPANAAELGFNAR